MEACQWGPEPSWPGFSPDVQMWLVWAASKQWARAWWRSRCLCPLRWHCLHTSMYSKRAQPCYSSHGIPDTTLLMLLQTEESCGMVASSGQVFETKPRCWRERPTEGSRVACSRVSYYTACTATGIPKRVLRSCTWQWYSTEQQNLQVAANDGIIVVGGRLKYAALTHRSKHPIILPHNHKLSRMIVQDYHGATHLGTEWTLSQVRGKFWIIKARNLIKSVKKKCVICRKLYGQPGCQKMADLPPERVVYWVKDLSHMWDWTSLDLFTWNQDAQR